MNTIDNLLLDYKNDMPEVNLDSLPTKSNYNESKSYRNELSDHVSGSGTMQMAYDGHLSMGLGGLLPKNIQTISPGTLHNMADVSFTSKTAFMTQNLDPIFNSVAFWNQAEIREKQAILEAVDALMENSRNESDRIEQRRQDKIQIASHISVHLPNTDGDYWMNTGVISISEKPEFRLDSYLISIDG